MVAGGLHVPTAVLVLCICLFVAGLLIWRRRSRERAHSFISEVDRATYETLDRKSVV